ncbi:MAG: ABC transporter substrate-binding protein [bacterium]|nr:ABC transporter substrate-binding protein [bacterium]
MKLDFNLKKKRIKDHSTAVVDTTAVIYALKTIKIDEEELLGINREALNILTTINDNENILAGEIQRVEEKGHKLYASIQIVSEAADVLIEYARSSNEKTNAGINEINNIIQQLTLFTESTSNILSFIQPFNEYSQKIGFITDIIFKIAQMSESAARNAGIKAYHAGESGRGFEVIADRMLLLANKTFKLTQKIPEGIDEIQKHTLNIIGIINQTKSSTEGMKKNIDVLSFRLKDVENNLHDIVKNSDRMKEFIAIQDNNKGTITDLNKDVSNIITSSLQSSEKLSTMVKTQADIKASLLNLMQQIDILMDMISSNRNLMPAISTEIKLFKKIENHLKNSKYISEQIITIIDEFIDNNSHQVGFITKYKDTIDSIEENEQMILKNVGEIEDSINLLMSSVNDFSLNVNAVMKEIGGMKAVILELNEIFASVSKNLDFIHETSNELKELSEQTRLLSLYASIEAARAGKFQQSLSVIVIQTKDLIVKASEASLEINKIVTNMQVVIHNVVDIVSSELSSADKIEFSIKNSKEIIDNIKESSDNFKSLLKEIYDSVSAQEKIRNDILQTYNGIKNETKKINDKANDLFSILKQDLLKNDDSIHMSVGIEDNMGKRFNITRNPEKNRFKFVMRNLPVHWHPSLIGDATSNHILQLYNAGLVKFGKDTNVIPSLAKYWQINEDATEWTFFLRENGFFHDGSPVTSEDVKESVKRVVLSPNAPFVNMLKGAQDYSKHRAKDVEGIKIIDDYTIKFLLEYPYIPFLSNLAVSPLSVIKKEMSRFTDEQMRSNPIGCGPFMVKEITDSHIILESNHHHFEGEPYLDTVEIIMGNENEAFEKLLEHSIDFATIDAENIDSLKRNNRIDIQVMSTPSLDVQYIGINMSKKNELTLYKQVRQAMNLATDKARYINETMNGAGLAAKGIFPPTLAAFNKSLQGYPYNPHKAKDLMREVGLKDGIKHYFEMICSDTERVVRRAEILRDMWTEIGIRIKVVPLPWLELLERMHSGKTELFMMGWAGDTGEPDNFLYPLFHSDSFGDGGNNTCYSNRSVDEMIVRARQITNYDMRMQLYQDIEKIIVEDAPMIFLTHIYNQVAVTNKVHGYYVHPLSVHPIEYVWKEWFENGD